METDKYRAILCAIDEGSLTAAADKLGYTPSGISRMVKTLEDFAGFKLINRERNGIVPTDECIKLIPLMRAMVHAESSYEQLVNEIKGLHTGSITIGSSIDVYFPLLSKIVAKFSAIYPHIHVNITEGLSSDFAKAVDSHQMDFCIISKRSGNFRWIPLTTDPLVAIVPLNSEYAKMETMPLNILAKSPFINIYQSDETDNSLMFKRNGISPKIVHSCTNIFVATSMVEAGLGITTENRLIANRLASNVKLLPLDPPQLVEIGIAAPQVNDASPASVKFLNFAEKELCSPTT